MEQTENEIVADFIQITARVMSIAGERDAKKLAALRDNRGRSTAEQIIEALHGDCREQYLFVLGQSRKSYQQLR